MSEMQQHLESILVADCGSTVTKVTLLDTVEGQYRFIAYAESPSTVNAPWEDLTIGIIHAISRLQETTGKTFLDEEQQLITPEQADGSGVDRFLAVSSAAMPLRIILAGLARDVSLASARRAALSTYTQIEDVIALEQGPWQEQPRTDDAKINTIWHKSPELICLVGGTDGGASTPIMEMVRNVIRVALYLLGDRAPLTLYAGNTEQRSAIGQMIGEIAPLQVVDNVRPQPEVENIGPASEEIEVIFYEKKISSLPGINTLTNWSPAIVLPTARAADYAIRYCEKSWKSSKPALGIDIGSSSVTINVCRNGQPATIIRTDLGVGYNLPQVLEQVEMHDLIRWLPFEISESEIWERLKNKSLRPNTLPQTREDILLEQAVARQVLRLTIEDSLPGWPGGSLSRQQEPMIPSCDPLIAGGSILTHVPYHGHAALILLDALQPLGINQLYLDEYNLVPALGTIATVAPLATVQTLHNGGLTFLGTAVVPSGHTKPGDKVLTIRSVDKDLGIQCDVKYGDLEAIPFQSLNPGTTLELIPVRGFDIGKGSGKSIKIQYRGGTVGLIVDARGRPLEFADDPAVQRQRMDYWLLEMMSA